ncbi:uroporphyrinogen-III synthase [Symbiobacterium terraclitae]|uniref:Uroporphyrinogen-III synthase n=1 Tax=Symbiobacterium terraclitae TaxID=557451 RepID=A0ABS4JSU9_9FIRM|nr:uroporphyrinogen-III synthase [Symbiobacterium terraclitae]
MADGDAQPLRGRRILVLRARDQAERFIRAVAELGGEAVAYPVIQIVDPQDWAPLDEAIARLERYRWLVITSPNGAARFAARLARAGRRVPDGVGVVAVGTATARALEREGIRVDRMPQSFVGRAIPEALAGDLAPGDRVLMARGDLANPALASALAEMGAVVDDLVAYRNVPVRGDAEGLRRQLQAGAIHYVAFTSGSTVHNLLDQLGGPEALGPARVACIGPETAAAAEARGLPVHCMAEIYTMDGLLRAIVSDCEQGGR